MRTIFLTASCLAAFGLAAFAQQNPPNTPQPVPQTPQPVPQTPDVNRPQDRDTRASSAEKSMSAQEAAEMFRTAKHSLTDSIATAERQSGGKAVAAHCCMKSQTDIAYLKERKSWPAGRPDVRRTNEQKRDEQGRDTPDQSRTVTTSEEGPVCIVTCLVGDNRLVEVVVCSKSNSVVADRPIDSISGSYRSAAVER